MNKVVKFFKTQIGQKMSNSPSPAGNWLNPVLLEIDEGKIIAEYIVRDEMTNPAGTLHGGMIALIADEQIGATIATLDLPEIYVSINLNTEFLFSAKKGETVTAKTQIIRKGKNIINSVCEIYNTNNQLIAKASSNNYKLPSNN